MGVVDLQTLDVVTLPFEEVSWLGGDIANDGRRFVFSVLHTRSDAWLVEDFDPELR